MVEIYHVKTRMYKRYRFDVIYTHNMFRKENDWLLSGANTHK
jgi:hypothetical protein